MQCEYYHHQHISKQSSLIFEISIRLLLQQLLKILRVLLEILKHLSMCLHILYSNLSQNNIYIAQEVQNKQFESVSLVYFTVTVMFLNELKALLSVNFQKLLKIFLTRIRLFTIKSSYAPVYSRKLVITHVTQCLLFIKINYFFNE